MPGYRSTQKGGRRRTGGKRRRAGGRTRRGGALAGALRKAALPVVLLAANTMAPKHSVSDLIKDIESPFKRHTKHHRRKRRSRRRRSRRTRR